MVAHRIDNFAQTIICSIKKFFEKKKIYYDPLLNDKEQDDFRNGEAWMVNPDPNSLAGENFGNIASHLSGAFRVWGHLPIGQTAKQRLAR